MDPPEYDAEGNGSDEVDALTALEFSGDGEYLATGDRNGRLTVLRMEKSSSKKDYLENWLPHCQFTSHDPEFDFLKSLEIEAKINQIKFFQPSAHNNLLLTTNDKTVKLWKFGRRRRYVSRAVERLRRTGRIELPEEFHEPVELVMPSLKRTFSNAHAYHINSLSINSDCETFISADDLRINLWRLDSEATTFNLVDIKPDSMEELTEVITAVQCHPQHCNILSYCSSRGIIKMCDTRVSAICRSHSKMFLERTTSNVTKSFITDILNSISDINYSNDGRYIVSRDYMTVKIWDVNMESRPVVTIHLHDYLKPLLYDLYTADIIFDKFEVCCAPNGRSFATGSYGNQLKVYNSDSRGLRSIELPRISTPEGEPISPTPNVDNHLSDVNSRVEQMKLKGDDRAAIAKNPHANNNINFDEKVLLCAWHPQNNTVAVAGRTGLCLYKA